MSEGEEAGSHRVDNSTNYSSLAAPTGTMRLGAGFEKMTVCVTAFP